MNREKRKHLLLMLAGVGLLMLMLLAVESGHRSYQQVLQNDLMRKAQDALTLAGAQMVTELSSEIYMARGLATYVSVDPDSEYPEWQNFTQQLFNKTRLLQGIALAPDDVVRFVYPLEGNEAVLNLDYRDIPEQYLMVSKARQTGEMQMAGPLSLVQGGKGVIVRIPVYTDPPQNTRYWGATSIVINLDQLLADDAMVSINQQFELAIRGVDGAGPDGEVFFGDPAIFDQAIATHTLHLPAGQWVMAATLKADSPLLYPWYVEQGVRIAGWVVVALTISGFAVVYYLYRRAQHMSLIDELTQLTNRRGFMLELNHTIDLAGQRHSSFAVLNIDLDRFKFINDSMGHAAGDALLVEVSKRLFEGVRTTDVVARTGGDEFLILLTRVTEKETVHNIAETLHHKLCDTPFVYRGSSLSIKASIGFARYPEDADSIDQLLLKADESMYRVKRAQAATA